MTGSVFSHLVNAAEIVEGKSDGKAKSSILFAKIYFVRLARKCQPSTNYEVKFQT